MATDKQKEELMATLKFTPRNYRVEIWGYGGEIYWGTVDRKIYDFFKDKEIDIEQYASSWDDDMWADIPDDMRPFPPGSPYECDHGCHESGATVDSGSYITVYDETGEQVWQSSLDGTDLAKQGVEFDCIDEHYLADYDEGTVVFQGAQGEKGLFFGNEFEIKSPFDPAKLRITYTDCDGWSLTCGVSYDGEDIDGNDYDTNGKWGENKWIVIGDEVVYDGVERDEDSYENTSDDNPEIDLNDAFDNWNPMTDGLAALQDAVGELEAQFGTVDDDWDPAAELDKIQVPESDWTDKSIEPTTAGEYDVVLDAPWPTGGMEYVATWTGSAWELDGETIAIHRWRETTDDESNSSEQGG